MEHTHDLGRPNDGTCPACGHVSAAKPVSAQDAQDAMIYRNGILDYNAHDIYLTALGYSYLGLFCRCGGSDTDGHLPSCGWGKLARPFSGRHDHNPDGSHSMAR